MSNNIMTLVSDRSEILHKPVEKFTFDPEKDGVDAVKLAQILYDNMMEHNGIGLSANQLGLPNRAFIMRGNPCVVAINPRIIDVSEEKIYLEEGCLSYPDLFVKISRPKSIKVRFQDPTGEIQNEKYTGMTARIFQHEMDHMEGNTFTDLASKFHLDKARKDKKLIARRRKRAAKNPKKVDDTIMTLNTDSATQIDLSHLVSKEETITLTTD